MNNPPMYPNFPKAIFLLFAFCLGLGELRGQSLLEINADSNMYALGKHVEILEDPSGLMDFAQVLKQENQERFKLSESDAIFHHYSRSSFWFKLHLKGAVSSSQKEWFIEFQNPNIDTVTVYFLNEKGELIQSWQAGDMFPFSKRAVESIRLTFPVPFEKSKEIFLYINLRGNYVKIHNLFLAEKYTMLKRDYNQFSFYIFLNSILLALLIYNILLYLNIFDKVYFYYICYLFFSLLYIVGYNGFLVVYLFPENPFYASHFNSISSIYFGISFLLFVYYFLNTKKILGEKSLILVRSLIIIGNVLVLLMLANIWEIDRFPVLLMIAYFITLCVIVSFYFLILGLLKKIRAAIFLTISSCILFPGLFINLLKRIAVFDVPDILADNSMHIGIVMESILISFALADRIKISERERRKAQYEKIQALKENELIIQEQKIQLEQKVIERTAEIYSQKEEIETQNFMLNEKSKKLEEVNATKDKLFAIIGHDLRSPIHSLNSLMEMLDADHISREEFMLYSNKLRNGVENAYFTLNNLLEWANSQMQGLNSNPKRIVLNELVKKNIALFAQLASAKKIGFVNKIEEDIQVFADPDQINIVFRNLISNAIKFTPEGGQITLFCKFEGQFCEIGIQDTGVGMREEDIGRLFQKSSHYSTYGTEGEKGTGLGLLLCQEMIEKNGGQLWVESTLQKGSVFKFTIPGLDAVLLNGMN